MAMHGKMMNTYEYIWIYIWIKWIYTNYMNIYEYIWIVWIIWIYMNYMIMLTNHDHGEGDNYRSPNIFINL